MTDKPRLEPSPAHPITITERHDRVVVTVAGRVVADTRRALTLQEASYPPVQYIPIDDVDQSLLRRTTTQSHCPYKGGAGYYSVVIDEDQAVDAVWEYRDPFPAVAPIKGHVAFYPDRVEAIDIEADGDRS